MNLCSGQLIFLFIDFISIMSKQLIIMTKSILTW